MTTPSGLVLPAGTYLLELTLGGGLSTKPDELRRALELTGWDSVVLDDPEPFPVPPAVGAAMLSPTAPARAAPTTSLAVSRASALAAPHVSVKPSETAKIPTAYSPLDPRAPSALTKLPPLGAASRGAALAQAHTSVKPRENAKIPVTPKPKPGIFGFGDGDGGGGDAPAPDQVSPPADDPAAAASFVEDPSDPRYATDQTTGQRYYLDPDSGIVYGVDAKTGELLPVDQQTLAPIAGPHLPPPPPPDAGSVDAAGSPDAGALDAPFGEDPAFSMHVGGIVPDEVLRAVARTPSLVTLKPAEHLSWGARRLSVDPYADLPHAIGPAVLATGKTYDLIVLSRDRRGRRNSRGDVWTLLDAMGFRPDALSLLQRDIHLPGRPGASYSRWLAVALWRGPATILTAEEPLLFVDVKEAPPAAR